MKVRDVMTPSPATCEPNTPLRLVAQLMADHECAAIPIARSGELVGIVTDRDIVVRAVAEGKDSAVSIGEVMTAEVFAARENEFVFEAIRLMGNRQVRRVPIVNAAGELVGIIAMADIALETEDQREIAETLEEISSGAGFWNKN
jgi:signal-transduction protein with cAMP-binding, CBS, and nucleotidyltransferase domain